MKITTIKSKLMLVLFALFVTAGTIFGVINYRGEKIKLKNAMDEKTISSLKGL